MRSITLSSAPVTHIPPAAPNLIYRTDGLRSLGLRVVMDDAGSYPVYVEAFDGPMVGRKLVIADSGWVFINAMGYAVTTREAPPGSAALEFASNVSIIMADTIEDMLSPGNSNPASGIVIRGGTATTGVVAGVDAGRLRTSAARESQRVPQAPLPPVLYGEVVVTDAAWARTVAMSMDWGYGLGSLYMPGDALDLKWSESIDGVIFSTPALLAATVPNAPGGSLYRFDIRAPFVKVEHGLGDDAVPMLLHFAS